MLQEHVLASRDARGADSSSVGLAYAMARDFITTAENLANFHGEMSYRSDQVFNREHRSTILLCTPFGIHQVKLGPHALLVMPAGSRFARPGRRRSPSLRLYVPAAVRMGIGLGWLESIRRWTGQFGQRHPHGSIGDRSHWLGILLEQDEWYVPTWVGTGGRRRSRRGEQRRDVEFVTSALAWKVPQDPSFGNLH